MRDCIGVEGSGGCCPSLGEVFSPIIYWGSKECFEKSAHSSVRRALNQFGVTVPIRLRVIAVLSSMKDRPSSVAKELMKWVWSSLIFSVYADRFSGGKVSRIILSFKRFEVKAAGRVSVCMEKPVFARHFSTVDNWLFVASGEQSVGWENAQNCAHLILFRSCSCFRASLFTRDPSSFSLIMVSEIWMAG